MKTISAKSTFISRLFFRNKMSAPSEVYYYEEILDKYGNGLFYKSLKERLLHRSGEKTAIEIKVFENKDPDGTAVKDILRQYGKPNCKILMEDFPDIFILFYKRQIGEYKIKMEFHFYNKRLFFFSYTFPYVSRENNLEVARIIIDKYLGDNKYRDLLDIYIIDRNKNVILPDNIFGFSVYYFCPEGSVFREMIKYIDNRINNDKLRKEVSRKILYNRI